MKIKNQSETKKITESVNHRKKLQIQVHKGVLYI